MTRNHQIHPAYPQRCFPFAGSFWNNSSPYSHTSGLVFSLPYIGDGGRETDKLIRVVSGSFFLREDDTERVNLFESNLHADAVSCRPMPGRASLNHAVVLATMDRHRWLVCGQVPEDWGVGAISTTVWSDETEESAGGGHVTLGALQSNKK